MKQTKGSLDIWRGFDRLFGERGLLDFEPLCDVEEDEQHFTLTFDLPGVTQDDVRVELRDNQLVVSGERKREESEKKGTVYVAERAYGSFSRSFTLPQNVDLEKIEASFEDGVLCLSVPKADVAKPRQIPIGKAKKAAA
jgi:HSP20 family protein